MHALRVSIVTAALLSLTCFATTAQAAPSIVAPKVAHVGDRIVVTATGLRPGRYTLTLSGGTPPDRLSACAAPLAKAKARSTRDNLRFEARIPSRIGCYSGYPSSFVGRVTTTPGRYELIVAVPRSTITYDYDYSVLMRKLKLRD